MEEKKFKFHLQMNDRFVLLFKESPIELFSLSKKNRKNKITESRFFDFDLIESVMEN